MAKIITRSEVNAIVEGTFSTDLTKAVLYGEVSGNPNFIVSAVNSVSQLNYTASQALLEVDIRRATSLVVTLTPRTTDILSTDTTIVFDITTGGTGTITSLEPVVVTRGGVDISTNFSIAADGKNRYPYISTEHHLFTDGNRRADKGCNDGRRLPEQHLCSLPESCIQTGVR